VSRPRFLVRLLAVADRVNLPLLASALTFDALMAMIPLAILVVAGLGYLLEQTSYFGTSDPGALVGAFLPVHLHRDGTPDPFALVESILASVRSYRSKLTLVAIPAFVWFGSRVFASIRVCLSQIFQVRGPQRHPSLVLDYLIGYGFGKLRDVVMLGVMLVLALANTVLSAGVAVLTAEGVVVPRGLGFFTTGLGVVLTEVVAIGSALALFLLLTLAAYLGARRARYFGNTAPVIVLVVSWLLACTGLAPDTLAYGAFPVRALPFVFVFFAGVAADVLEMPVRRTLAPLIVALLLSHATIALVDLKRGGGSAHPFRVEEPARP